MTHVIDVKAVLRHFGGTDSVVEGLSKIGVKGCSKHAIGKWLERRVIPIKHVLALKDLASASGENFWVDSFIIERR